MSARAPADEGNPPTSLLAQLDRACDRYERAWRAGLRPRIEDYVDEVAEEGRPALRRELLMLERAYRHREGDSTRSLDDRPWFLTPGGSEPLFPTERVDRRFAPPPLARPSIAGYEILDELGRGSMGVVYRAWQPRLHRAVALKMVLAGAHADRQRLTRFHTEAEAAARLQHPHIVQIFEVGEHEGLPFLVLEHVEGGSLARKLAGAPLPLREAAALAGTLARAIHHAHQRGVVHRDLKPGNILLMADGAPKVADFGLAKLLIGGGESLTRTGQMLGTPCYMAPEQAGAGARVGPAADVYALGAILYELLTGRPPFRAESSEETIRQVVSEEPVSPSRLRPRLPLDL
jgi:serine/threonine protein kinase